MFPQQKENVTPESMSSFIFRSQCNIYAQNIEDRCRLQIQTLEDRSHVVIDELVKFKEMLVAAFPRELLELSVESFFEEFEGNFELMVKEGVKKMGVQEKCLFKKEKVPQKKELDRVPEFLEDERQNFEDCVMFTEKKPETPKNFKFETFSKKKIDFSEKGDFGKIISTSEKSMKKPWMP